MRRLLDQYGGWVWLCVALAIVGVLSVIASASPAADRPLAADNAKPDGGLALYLWLQRIGYRVETAHSPDPSGLHPGETLLLLDPFRDLSARERRSLQTWVRAGGDAVLVTDGTAARTFKSLGMRLAPAPADDVSIQEPLLLSPPAATLSGQTGVVGEIDLPGEVAGTPYGPALVMQRLGQGRLWLLTAPALLDNSHIAAADNRRFALNLLGSRGTAIRFAEVDATAPATGTTDWLTGTAWGIAMIFVLAVALLYRWLGGWRLGPALVPFSERRRPAVEYVISLADLLRRGRKRAEVLRIYQRTLRQDLARRYGRDDPEVLPPELRDQVGQLLATPTDLSEEKLLAGAAAIVQCEEAMRRARV